MTTIAITFVAGCSSGPTTTTAAAETATTAPTTATSAQTTSSNGTPTRWTPDPDTSWQWELDHPLRLTSAIDMGTGVPDYLGRLAPDPTMYDIDGFDNGASTVAALHRRGARAVCYVEVGAIESYRPDVGSFPRSVIGRVVDNYPEEHYLDIGSPVVRRLIEARMTMCATKGFDAVEPDIDDSYTENTGFPLSQADEVGYDKALADFAHAKGLSIALKNGDDPAFSAALEPYFDFVIDEQCFQFGTCGSFSLYVKARKAVFEVEYQTPTTTFCAEANRRNFNAARFKLLLDGPRLPCR